MKMAPDRFQQTAGSVAAETANAPIRGAKAQMGLPPDAPLPGKTLRHLIRSGAAWSMGPDTFLLEQTFLSAPMIY